MKKLLLVTLFTSAMFVCTHAQHTNFGLKAGVNLASMESSGDDLTTKVGLHVGGLAHIHLSRQFALQPELVYSMQGGEDGDTKAKFDYLNIPVLVQYMTSSGFRLQTGPQLGFLTSAKIKNGNVETNVKDNFSSTDFSWVFGAGFLFPSGFGIDARYNLGLNNVNDDDNFTIKNRVGQIGVFYQFASSRK